MNAQPTYAAILAFAIVNGIFSPLTAIVFVLYPLWYPFFAPAMPSVLFFAASLIVATGTIMLAGVPAAIFERLSGRSATDATSALVWLAATALLSLPAVTRAVSMM